MIRLAILGAGGLGKGMAQFVQSRPDFRLVAMADSQGYCFNAKGLDAQTIAGLETVAHYPQLGTPTEDAVIELLKNHGGEIDAVFKAMPNFPVGFCADMVSQIAQKTDFKGVVVDALKRTKAVEQLKTVEPLLNQRGILYVTGAGATPGFLTTVAAVAALSFAEVLSVDIRFGVGIANWEQYKATVREDFIHLEGFDAARVARMTDAEIQDELDKRNGLLELNNMEHADDVILELAGVCPRERVTVGGIVDTRNAKKPVSTTVTVTGRTISGATGSHQFVVSDETTMVDNVCGPALGFMLSAFEQNKNGRTGIVTSADLMPRFASKIPALAAV